MFVRPDDLTDTAVASVLGEAWAFHAVELAYAPVGFGSHHWVARDERGDGRFVTVDALDAKRLDRTETNDGFFERLRQAFTAVHALKASGMDGTVAPIPAGDGRLLVRVDPRYSMVVHPLIDGRPADEDGDYARVEDRRAVLALLVDLHGRTEVAAPHAGRETGAQPNGDALEDALAIIDDPWETGPYGEPARALLREHADDVVRLVEHFDALAVAVLGRPERIVVTHGEPHAGNVLLAGDRHLLIDWDTTLLAPPERDLWAFAEADRGVLDAYRSATGVEIDHDALAYYRLWFDLMEIGGYLRLFCAPHDDDADARESWKNLLHYLRPRQRWPAWF